MPLSLTPPGQRESLDDHLADLGRLRKRVAILAGFSLLFSVIAGGVSLACALDLIFHLSPLVRAAELVLLLVCTGVVWFRYVGRAVSLRTDPLSIALELEDRHPTLNDALASAIAFLVGGKDEHVSNRLQHAAIRSATRLAERHHLQSLVPTGLFWKSFALFVIVLLTVTPLALIYHERGTTALERLADPFGNHPWPTKTRIEILVPQEFPTRLPKGDVFELKFAVRGVITERATVSFRLADEEFQEQYPLVTGGDPRMPSAAVVAARIDAARLPSTFAFRVAANDFETEWKTVEVVPPPRLVDLAGRPSPQFHIVPPAYTGLPAIQLPDGAVVLEIPVGTAVSLRAGVDLPITSASLVYQGDMAAIQSLLPFLPLGHLQPCAAIGSVVLGQSIGSPIPLTIGPDQRTLWGSFVPAMSGIYALKLTDETGVPGTRLIDIRLVPDPSPVVTLFRPTAETDPSLLTPTASLFLDLSAEDRVYALHGVFLEYRTGAGGPVRRVPLIDLVRLPEVLPAVTGVSSPTSRLRLTMQQQRVMLPLASFLRDDGTPVREGDVLFVRACADDWDDVVPLKPPGRSAEVEIHIASRETIEAWLQKELAGLRPEFSKLRDQQHEARLRTSEVLPLPDETLKPADRDKLLAAEQTQRIIRAKVADTRDGLLARAALLRQTVRVNELPRSLVSERVEAIADELARMAERDLPPIEANLTGARQIVSDPAAEPRDEGVPGHLKKAVRHQKAVEDSLTTILDLLAVWGSAGEIRGEARVLRQSILRHVADLEKLAEHVPTGKPLESLTPHQQADLERAAARAESSSEQAGTILARAARLAQEKERQAAEAKAAELAKATEASRTQARARELPAGSAESSALETQSNLLKGQAEDAKAAAAKASAEAVALRKAVAAAGGQALPDDLRKAAEAIRGNRQAEAAALQRSGMDRLDRLIAELTEKQPEAAPDLMKFKPLADEIDALAAAEADLQKSIWEASRNPDPAARKAALAKLAPQQDKLIQRGKEIFQRLVREGADSAARDARNALDRMETSRDDLEKGKPNIKAQNDVISRLDHARDNLDSLVDNAAQHLSDEKRRKLADRVKALLDRQNATLAEAKRIHGVVKASQKWERPQLASYSDLEERQRQLAGEVRGLGEKEFAPLPVLARLLTEAAAAGDTSCDKIKIRREDALDADPAAAYDAELESANDRRVTRPMEKAVLRLQQLRDALEADSTKPAAKQDSTAQNPANPMPGGGNSGELIPPQAQLKVLEALQAEVNQRTAAFAKAHPDTDKLTDDERDELKELEEAQREIPALFEKMAGLFQPGNPNRTDKAVKPEAEAKP
jgi:hypothetical protein